MEAFGFESAIVGVLFLSEYDVKRHHNGKAERKGEG